MNDFQEIEAALKQLPKDQLAALEIMCRTVCESILTGETVLLMTSRKKKLSVQYSSGLPGEEHFRDYVSECGSALMDMLATAPYSETEH